MQDTKLATCSVCAELAADPRILPCLHVYCLECAGLRVGGPARAQVLTCALCNAEAAVPAGGIEALPQDFAASNVLKAVAAAAAAPARCGLRRSHADRPAAAVCLDCSVSLCSDCEEAHSESCTTATHRLRVIIPGEALQPSLLAADPLCPSHSGKKLEYFCASDGCKTAACADCVITKHKDGQHTLIAIAEATAAQSAAIRAAVTTASAASARLQATSAAVEQQSQAVTARASAAEAEVHRACNNIVEAVRSREQVLCLEVHAAARAKKKNLDIQRDGLLLLQQHIERAAQHSADVLSCCSGAQIVAAADGLLKRCEQLAAEAAAEPAEPVVESAVVVDVDAAAADLIAVIGTFGVVTDTALNVSCFSVRPSTGHVALGAAVGGAGAAVAPAAVEQPLQLHKAGDTAVLVIECNTGVLGAASPATLRSLLRRAVDANLRVQIPPEHADNLQCSALEVAADGRSACCTLTLRSEHSSANADVVVPVRYCGTDIQGSPYTVRLATPLYFMPELSVGGSGGVSVSHPAPDLVTFTGYGTNLRCHAFGNIQMHSGKWQWTFEITAGSTKDKTHLFLGCALCDQANVPALMPHKIATGMWSFGTGCHNRGIIGDSWKQQE